MSDIRSERTEDSLILIMAAILPTNKSFKALNIWVSDEFLQSGRSEFVSIVHKSMLCSIQIPGQSNTPVCVLITFIWRYIMGQSFI